MSTPLLGLYAPATGADGGTWGDNWNNQGSTYLDNIIAGLSTIAITGATYTLSAAEARTQMIRLTGVMAQNCTISAGGGVLWNGIRCIENLTTGNYTITLSNAGGTCTVPQGHRGLYYLDTTYGPRAISDVNTASGTVIPSGTVMTFYQAAAPSGWTQVTSITDYALRITSGTGGGTGGSVNFSTLFARTATDSYTLQVADIPSHSHTVSGGTSGSATTSGISDGSSFTGLKTPVAITIGNTGGGGGHTHAIDMRVKYADLILASRI